MSAVALAALIRERQPCIVLTGAGVSTESGIPDFRSETGIWAEVDPFEVASLRAFKRDPERVWSFYRERLHVLRDAKPNAVAAAVARARTKYPTLKVEVEVLFFSKDVSLTVRREFPKGGDPTFADLVPALGTWQKYCDAFADYGVPA